MALPLMFGPYVTVDRAESHLDDKLTRDSDSGSPGPNSHRYGENAPEDVVPQNGSEALMPHSSASQFPFREGPGLKFLQ
jgi:hypothetical protein